MTAFYELHKTSGFSPKVKVIGVGCGGAVDKPRITPPHCSWGGYQAERRLEEAIKKESLAGWKVQHDL